MRKLNLTIIIALLTSTVLFTGCVQNSKSMILENTQQLKVRSYQIKKYNKSKLDIARAVVSTLQDLSFIIDKADIRTGTITATKLLKNASMRITIIVRDKGKSTQVRANAQFASANKMPEAVTEPKTYQTFYSALDKAVFLENQGL
jgi:hypothetical protein